ncbi:MAG TPA: alcohol dehydrogenase catalytic domain-containing protein [Pyrinomonadaceae bacterium]|nr:alcohol dehydrogenase catalytic domain-containing protein [Pyrinomonadaceae bacterium]
MRAAVVPALNKKWEIREVPTPEPSTNQVLIKIRASGLCYTDIHFTEGVMPHHFPCILGHEPVGEIVAVGAGVTTRKMGDRVGVPWDQASCGRCEWCQRSKAVFCAEGIATGVQLPGGHAEYMVAYADATMLLPEGLSYEQAAPLFCAGYTVWSGLRFADPKPHERIAVLGIGGLGHLAVQYAKAAGFETIAITHSEDKKQLVRDLGADEVVANGETLSAAGGADVILATSNSYAATSEALKGLRPDGRLILMGVSPEPLQLTDQVLFQRHRIIGSIPSNRGHLYEALDYAAKGKVKVMTETYSLNEIGRAYERVARSKVRFRAVIVD